MALRRGDIVLATHADLGKPRPAVVIQADEFIENAVTILICPLTTDLSEKLPLRPIVPADSSTGLRERSQIMTDKMLALRRDRVRSVLGRIGAATSDELDRALLIILGLARS
jgi:mRNA interferase MazF